MARFPLNFNNIDDKSFPVYPVGRYTLRITECRQEPSKASQELVERVKFEIVSGPGASPEYAGKSLLNSYSLQEKAGFRIQKLLMACGFAKDALMEIDDQQLVGCVITADMTVDEYPAGSGKKNNKIQNEAPVAAAGASAPTPSFPAPSGFAAPAPAGAPVAAPAAPAWGAPAWGAAPGPNGPAAPAPPPAKPAGT